MARTSPPAQKARPPSPRTITAWTSGSFPQAINWGSNFRYMASDSVLSAFGRLSAMMPSPPRRSRMISSVMRGLLIPWAQQATGDDDAHDLVGAFEYLVHAQIAQIALDRIFLDVAVAAVQLQRLVDDLETGVGGEALGHGALGSGFGIVALKRTGGAMHHEPRRVELGRHVGEAELERLELGERLAELLALDEMALRRFEAGARAAERAGADVDAAAIEPHHRDLEAHAFAAQQIGSMHAAILEDHHGGRLAVPAELLLLLAEGQALAALLDQDAGNAVRPLAAGARHHGIDVAGAAARDERLGAVEDEMIALAPGAGLERRGVGAGARLGQAIAREMRHGQKLGQEFPALRLVAEAVDHPRHHVVDREIGRGRRTGGRQLLEDQRRLEPSHAGAAGGFVHIDARESERRRLAQRLDREDAFLVPLGGMRQEFRCGEVARGFTDGPVFLGKLEIHAVALLGARNRRDSDDIGRACERQRGAVSSTG